jgi:hypothetical protein
LKYLKDTPFHKNVLHVLSYDFGDIYLYDTFVIAEFRAGVVVSWDHIGRMIADEIRGIYGAKSKELIYISNRINNYSVSPSDWLKFHSQNYCLRGYGIVGYTKRSYFNAMLEKIFVRTQLKWFDSLEPAIQWAQEGFN